MKPARGHSHAFADARATLSTFGGSLLSLEARIMFDGAAVATVSTVTTEQIAQSQAEASFSADDAATADTAPAAPTGEPQPTTGDQALFDALAAYDTSVARQEIVFLSSSVLEYKRLLDGISPNVEVFVLDPARDGVEQMAETLAGRTGIDAIHIISHGAPAELTLGTARLTFDSMNGVYANELAVIGQSLSEKADLLIYGCNFGLGQDGAEATMRLGQLTGADVAASTDDTGHASLGGDWDLEYAVGCIETSQIFTMAVKQNWSHLMATETILDNFSSASYSNNNGTQSWSTSWVETETGGAGPGAGDILITSGQLFIDAGLGSGGNNVYREVNLTGAVSATLSYAYNTALGVGGAIEVQISDDGGANYTTLETYTSSLPASGTGNFDITSYLSANTRLRFEVTGTLLFNNIQFDNVEISYITNDAPVITNLAGDSLSYNEGDGAVVIEQGVIAIVLDADSADFDTGTLIVAFVAGSDSAEDVLAIRDQGTGAGQIGVSGSTVTYGGTTIGTVAGGSGGNDLVVTFNSNATPAAAQTLIRNITYENTDTDNPTTGARTVRFVVTDGDGGSSGNQDTTVTVTTVNDAPVNTVPGAQVVNEDTALALGGVSVNDVDGNVSTVQLGVTQGTVTVSLAGGATISSGANGTATFTLSGTQAQINAALGTLAYQGTLNYSGPDTLTVTSRDTNLVTDVDTVAITVSPVNDAPVNTVPGAQVVNEDTALALGGVSVNDVDGNVSTVQLGVTQGMVTVSLAGGATISSGANGTATLTLSGTQVQINAALGTLAYQGTLNYSGPDTLTITSTDTGSAIDLDTITITANPVNDAPVVTSNGGGATAAVDVAENQTPITTVTSADVDGGVPTYSIIGGPDAALFTLNATTGALTFNNAPDFETPVDAGANNVYDVTVQVTDGSGGTDIQALSITVKDVTEGQPPITPLPPNPPIPPSLVPQSPAPPSAGLPPVGSPPLMPPIVVGTPVNPKPNLGSPVVPVGLGNIPGGTAPPLSEAPVVAAHRGGNTPGPPVPLTLMRELRGYLEERVAPLIHQAGEEVQKTFGGQTLEEAPGRISAAYRNRLNAFEEGLQRAVGTAESQRQLIVHVKMVGGVTLTAGLVTWLLRSGSLLASLATNLPAWRHLDPLSVVLVGSRERRKRERDAAAAAQLESKQFRGLGTLLDHEGDRPGQGG